METGVGEGDVVVETGVGEGDAVVDRGVGAGEVGVGVGEGDGVVGTIDFANPRRASAAILCAEPSRL